MSMINDILKSAVNNVQREKDEFDVEKWAEEKNSERQWAYQTQDEMATKITEDSKLYQTYLDVQSKFPTYSVGNALLVTAQNPKATQLKDVKTWKKEKVSFAGKPNKIIILEQGNIYTKEDRTEAQGYDPKRVYDISDMRVKRQLNTLPYTKEQILKAVLSMSPVEVQVVSNVANNKVVNFNVKNRTIEVSENAEINSIIQGLVREIASIHTLSFAESEFNTFKNELEKSLEDKINFKYRDFFSKYIYNNFLKGNNLKKILVELDKIINMYSINNIENDIRNKYVISNLELIEKLEQKNLEVSIVYNNKDEELVYKIKEVLNKIGYNPKFLNIKEIKEISVKETLILEKQKKYSFSEVALVILNNMNL